MELVRWDHIKQHPPTYSMDKRIRCIFCKFESPVRPERNGPMPFNFVKCHDLEPLKEGDSSDKEQIVGTGLCETCYRENKDFLREYDWQAISCYREMDEEDAGYMIYRKFPYWSPRECK